MLKSFPFFHLFLPPTGAMIARLSITAIISVVNAVSIYYAISQSSLFGILSVTPSAHQTSYSYFHKRNKIKLLISRMGCVKRNWSRNACKWHAPWKPGQFYYQACPTVLRLDFAVLPLLLSRAPFSCKQQFNDGWGVLGVTFQHYDFQAYASRITLDYRYEDGIFVFHLYCDRYISLLSF